MRTIAAFILGLMTATVLAQIVTSPTSNAVPVIPVASLPACNAASEGAMYGVNNALAPVALATVAGGGAIHTLVYCNGSNWIVG
jgi:FAD/FMN-containing dehydrogenase